MYARRRSLLPLFFRLPVILTLLVCAAAVALTVRGCGGGFYASIEGVWRGEFKGQPISAEFHPRDGVAVFDGKSGAMSLRENNGDTVTLNLSDPSGRSGAAVLHRIDDRRIRLEIPAAAIEVDLERVE